ncbi:MAG: hypothetical protein GXO22_03030 [Aquificae bacterium]|nr:hypothetical protein [Aquificota bacterium]
MDWNTFFLGIIAICMIIITLGMIVMGILMILILKVIRDLLIEIKLDYKALSPKIARIIEDVEHTASMFNIFSFFFRKKKNLKK